MATEILRVENCLPDYFNRRSNATATTTTTSTTTTTTLNPRFCTRAPEKRIRGKKPKASASDLSKSEKKKHVFMEQVKIIRRGQSLDEFFKQNDVKRFHKRGMSTSSSSDLAFWPEIYAGSAFSMSPSPSSVPFPSFGSRSHESGLVDDSATRDLRRMLRLD